MMTLEDLNQQLAPMYRRVAEAEAQRILECKKDLEFWGWKPPTKWQRRKVRAQGFAQRFVWAWKALKGIDLMEDN